MERRNHKKALKSIRKNIAEKEKKKDKVITITCNDYENNLEELLNYIKSTGNIGHSFEVVVDPDNKDYKKSFGWDGDGGDSISDIKIS